MTFRTLYPTLLGLALLGGCAGNRPNPYSVDPDADSAPKKAEVRDADLIEMTYYGVDCLMANARKAMSPTDRILVASGVDLNNLSSTSGFGRVSAELTADRLAQQGLNVVDVRIRQNSLMIGPAGEFLLTRDIRELSETYNARFAVVSTYTRASDDLIVSLRAIDVKDNTVIGAADYHLPIGPRTRSLLHGGGF